MLEELTGIPVLGVVPYLPLELDDEDSLSERLSRREAAAESLLDVAVIRFPRISNFPDFEALEQVEGDVYKRQAIISCWREIGIIRCSSFFRNSARLLCVICHSPFL